MSRTFCYRCFWPSEPCWCSRLVPMEVRTRLVILMHPKEFKREKAATGRLAALSFAGSQIHMGVNCDAIPAVDRLLDDPESHCVLLYPSADSITLGEGRDPDQPGLVLPPGKRLTVFVLDATWACAAAMFRSSPRLRSIPRVQFRPRTQSRFYIKRQPRPECLSTAEAVHELFRALEAEGLDSYPLPDQLLEAFMDMQAFFEAAARSHAGTSRSYRIKQPSS